MKIFGTVMKIVAALATIAGAVYLVATYGDKLVAWAKKLLNCTCCDEECCCEGECECCCEEAPAEECCCECACEEAAVEEAAEEAPAEEVATEADFAE